MKYSRYNKGPRQRKFKSQKELLRYLLKADYKRRHSALQVLEPLTEESRVMYDEYGDDVTEYGFIKGSEDWTDDEIEMWRKTSWIRIYSPYDCTGRLFTCWITCHRNPNGVVSFVHRLGRDV